MRIPKVVALTLAAVLGSGLGAGALDLVTRDTRTVVVPTNHPAPTGRVTMNRYIRDHGGIPACKHEDGSGQVKPCYWNGLERGNGTGRSYVIMPRDARHPDGRIVYLTR